MRCIELNISVSDLLRREYGTVRKVVSHQSHLQSYPGMCSTLLTKVIMLAYFDIMKWMSNLILPGMSKTSHFIVIF